MKIILLKTTMFLLCLCQVHVSYPVFPVLLWYSCPKCIMFSFASPCVIKCIQFSCFSTGISTLPISFLCIYVTLALGFLVPNCNKVLSCYVSCILHFGTWDVGVIQLWKACRTVTNIHEVTDTCSCICTQLQCMLQPSIKYLLPIKPFSTCKTEKTNIDAVQNRNISSLLYWPFSLSGTQSPT